MQIRVAEFFCGTKSFTNAISEFDVKTFTTDSNKRFNPDLVKNVLSIEKDDIPFEPHIIWMSPPCTWFSRASAWKHWTKSNEPKTIFAKCAIDIIYKCLLIASWFPEAYLVIENPVGKLRKLGLLDHLQRNMVQYCQYGEKREKPTDIFSNFAWNPRPLCNDGKPCFTHELQTDKLNKTDAAKVPGELCLEIFKILENKILDSWTKKKCQT